MRGRVLPGTRYRIVRWLGDGAMGVAYEAEHIEIERRAALKILRPELHASSEQAEAFRAEAKATSRIGSDHIITIFDFGTLEDGRVWYAMELLDSATLGDRIAGVPMDVPTVIGVLRQASKGLHAAHEAGVVHRDVKPENIMFEPRAGEPDRVKIVDFGVSSIVPTDHRITGTPGFMAPEVWRGAAFDGRVDIYSLGCVAYEALSGRLPFMELRPDQLREQHLNEAPPALSSVAEGRSIPAALEAVVMRCLAKDPEERYATMAELEAAVCEAQIAANVRTPWDHLALPRIDEERRRKLAAEMPRPTRRTNRWLAPLVAAVVMGGIVAYIMWPEAPSAESVSEAARLEDQARGAAAKALYVYPAPELPDEPTAYTSLLELEALSDGSGVERGGELRAEFASTLVRLGDTYWEREGGRPFAFDYYVQALVFDADSDRARERSTITPGELLALRARASKLEFTAAELDAADVLSALAEDDQDERRTQLLTAATRRKSAGSIRGQGLVAMLREEGVAEDELVELGASASALVEPGDSDAESDGGTVADAETDTGTETGEDETAGDETAEDESADDGESETDGADDSGGRTSTSGSGPRTGTSGGTGGGSTTGGSTPPPPKTDKSASKRHTTAGLAALKSGSLNKAEKEFHLALAANERNASAYMGLSDVEFNRGRYSSAVRYGAKAVRIAPNVGAYQLRLGDAYYKLFKYDYAVAHYEKAVAQGASGAQKRLDRARAKLAG